jgi:tetratricopeptide (TPR) repeat protein
MKNLILLIPILFFGSCQKKEKAVTHAIDYDKYLVSTPLKTTSKYFELWNSKIEPDSMQLLSFGIVGGEYGRYFQESGDIQFLKKAERALKRAKDIAAVGKDSYLRALARNYISQHRFKEALQLADSARAIGSSLNASQGLLFDIHMELGNYKMAEKYLDSIKNLSDFGYLIRLAKWNDHKGDLKSTITFMEKAKAKAINSKNKDLMLWSYTNLADYYGHAGRITDSYEHYLKALELDPKNSYAKKGIAWIVFSYEKNPKEALRILDSVTKNYQAPDYFLLKSEIAEYMGNELSSLYNLDQYFNSIRNPAYGEMYNAYNARLYLEQTGQYEKALQLSRLEVRNRPTPKSYSFLAFSYMKLGKTDRALDIVEKYIDGKTFEPAIKYYEAEIYKAAGKTEKVTALKNELLAATYELGPLLEHKISAL